MSHLWPYMRHEIMKAQFSPEQFEQLLKISKYKYSLHMVYFISDTLPKRIELGDAVETNAYHLFIYMLSRFYYFDNGGEIIYYYPNKHNNYLVEKALSLLPPRFKRETEKTPGYEYFEMPGCLWYTYTVGEPWMYSYVRNLYKEIWDSVPQVKGKYSYISRNPREAKARRCLNEAELFDPLKRAGYSIYTMEHMTFEEQIRLFRSSEIITGVHGAGMSWLLFCYPGTFLLEISIVGGESYHRPHYEDICLQTGLRYYRYTKTLAPDKSIYPDCVIDDCVVNPDDYVNVAKAIIQLKEEESKQAQH